MFGPKIAPMDTTRRAVVIGASIAGLLAARALSETFGIVTVIDRDRLPDESVVRRGIPQGKHLHGLLASGLTALDALFPGFEDELVAAGAVRGDIQSDIHWHIDGHLLKPDPSGLYGIAISRPLLELKIRQRVAALPGVQIIDNCDVLNLVTSRDRRTVTGVGVMPRLGGCAASTIDAALVVDASGRSSRTPVWLEELEYQRAPEDTMIVDTTYVTWSYRHEPHHLDGRSGTSIGAFPGSPRSGFLLAQENDMFIFTLGGIFGEQPPMDDEGQLAFVSAFSCKDFAEFLPTAKQVGEPIRSHYPRSVRRHYEKLTRFPNGFLVVGDAIASFNPIYGQGMSIAAKEAVLLRDLLATGPDDLARRFFRDATKLIEIPWTIATGSDMRFPEAEGTLPFAGRVVNRYLAHLYRAAESDATVARAFLRVLNLMDPLERLLAPTVAARVIRSSLVRTASTQWKTLTKRT
jgi:2-polyprenyl-6-methoxyphenol hydroxylase-like FAD-dependent oxidoreductase